MSNEVTITQMNEVIARFMGFDKVRVGYFGCDDETEWQRKHEFWMDKVGMESVGDYFVDVDNDEWLFCDDVNYDKSWDALMPVVAELKERFKETNKTNPAQTQMHNEGINFQLRIVNIASTHLAVFHAIRWYNQQKQNNEQSPK